MIRLVSTPEGPMYKAVKGPDGERFDTQWREGYFVRSRDRFAIGGTANDRRLMRNARKRERNAR